MSYIPYTEETADAFRDLDNNDNFFPNAGELLWHFYGYLLPDFKALTQEELMAVPFDSRPWDRLWDALAPVLPSISVANIAKESYGRSAQWFYQRMNGNIVNGRPARFSDTEIETLRAALLDLADRIRCAAESL